MLERLIIVQWSKSTGPIPIIQYPPEIDYPPKDLYLKIWAQHELNKDNTLVEIESTIEDKEIWRCLLRMDFSTGNCF